MIFKRIRPASLSEPIKSRDGCNYLFRGIKFVGWIRPEQRYRWLHKVWALLSFAFGTFYPPIGFVGNYVAHFQTFSAGSFIGSMMACCNAFASTIKCLASFYYFERMRKALDIFDRLDARCTLDVEHLQIRRVVARCNYIYLIYTYIYGCFVASTFLFSVYKGYPPWKLYNPFFNWQDSTAHFWLQSFYECFVFFVGVMQNQISDTYPIIYVLIIRTHLHLLSERMRNLRRDKQKSENENYEELVQCIVDHRNILEVCHTIRTGISITMFVQFLICGLALGLGLVKIFFFSTFYTGIPIFVALVKQIFATFPFAYTCDFVMADCNKLQNSLFYSNWLDAEQRYKKTILLFLHQIQKPIIFMSFMNIFQICIQSNLVVAKFSFTVITFANEMNLVEKFK